MSLICFFIPFFPCDMCGINGFVTRAIDSDQAYKLLHTMNDTLRHRGPDDAGAVVIQKNQYTLGLGHVRLSILDISPAGHQPMWYVPAQGACSHMHHKELYHSSQKHVVFNGEIYNFQDLRIELSHLGYQFNTQCDTEVLLASYDAWGKDCVKKFQGFWAFALYDAQKEEIFLSRDRMGKKPLYTFYDGGRLIWSSELKSLLRHENIPRDIDPEAIDLYLSLGYIPSPWTIYKHVRKLPARHSMVFHIPSQTFETFCYYDIPQYTPIKDKQKLLIEAEELLSVTTQTRLFADVPVGAFLSGGLDSSSIVGAMRFFTAAHHVHTFSIGFEWPYDETPAIQELHTFFETQHHHDYFTHKDFESMLETIAETFDEPFGDTSCFPTAFVAQKAKTHVSVALSGDGGDELFGWYGLHRVAAIMQRIRKIPRPIRSLILKCPTPNIPLLQQMREAIRLSLLPPESFLCERSAATTYRPEIYKQWTTQKMRECLAAAQGDEVQAMIHFDLFYNTLADNFLTKVDRASMLSALEVRSPFLDHRFVEYSMRIPSQWKTDGRQGKKLLRTVLKGAIPNSILKAKKRGFTPPIALWLQEPKYQKLLRDITEEMFADGILDQAWYDFLQSKKYGKNEYTDRLFLLILWYKKWYKK